VAGPYDPDIDGLDPEGPSMLLGELVDCVRVLIADDNADMRLLARATLGVDGRVVVVAEAEDGTAAVDAFRDATPDVCVLDQQMPGLNGLEAAQAILAERPGTQVLLFSAFLTDELTDEAGSMGVRCLRKDLIADLPDVIIDLVGG
jgi:DNA-binding NarL/FixJ family response regulator